MTNAKLQLAVVELLAHLVRIRHEHKFAIEPGLRLDHRAKRFLECGEQDRLAAAKHRRQHADFDRWGGRLATLARTDHAQQADHERSDKTVQHGKFAFPYGATA